MAPLQQMRSASVFNGCSGAAPLSSRRAVSGRFASTSSRLAAAAPATIPAPAVAESTPAAAVPASDAAPSSSGMHTRRPSMGCEVQFHAPTWSGVRSEADFFAVMDGLAAKGHFPAKLIPVWKDFFNNYKNAIVNSGVPGNGEELAARIQATIADCVMLQFVQPYTFPSFHQRMMDPYNYYDFGQRYVGALVDFETSVLGHPERWAQIEEQLAAKHNVVLIANHQTEADPGVFAHMLASSHPSMATDVIYVAGDRVVTDPLSKPFSMGRNLFCVHSKKHINDVPELKAAKADTNRKTLVAMSRRFAEGGALVWIAPSGGRDRRLTADGVEFLPDPFDPTAVELMRSLLARSKQPGHMYPMAMYSWPVMPPPKTVDKQLGERRLTNFTGVGISLAQELEVESVAGSTDTAAAASSTDKEANQQRLAQLAYEAVDQEYTKLMAAIKHASLRGPSTKYVQPWLQA